MGGWGYIAGVELYSNMENGGHCEGRKYVAWEGGRERREEEAKHVGFMSCFCNHTDTPLCMLPFFSTILNLIKFKD